MSVGGTNSKLIEETQPKEHIITDYLDITKGLSFGKKDFLTAMAQSSDNLSPIIKYPVKSSLSKQ